VELHKICGFFRHDKPGGLGFAIIDPTPAGLKHVADEINKAITGMKTRFTDQDLLDFLEGACQRKDTLTIKEKVGIDAPCLV
jgi:hypothetical protein